MSRRGNFQSHCNSHKPRCQKPSLNLCSAATAIGMSLLALFGAIGSSNFSILSALVLPFNSVCSAHARGGLRSGFMLTVTSRIQKKALIMHLRLFILLGLRCLKMCLIQCSAQRSKSLCPNYLLWSYECNLPANA